MFDDQFSIYNADGFIVLIRLYICYIFEFKRDTLRIAQFSGWCYSFIIDH